jgi:uncharacterized protein YecE (DUF72 family)
MHTNATEPTEGRIRVGPAGWAYPDWYGYAYPARRPRGFHPLAYLAEFFDVVEINTSFYHPVRAEHAAQWIRQIAANPRFNFTAKLWQGFTHGTTASADDEKLVRAGFDVLHREGRLGSVLVQFPFSFHQNAETTAYLAAILKRFSDYPLAVEFRHASWNTPEAIQLLAREKVAFCNIDQPVIGRSIEPTAIATSPLGYVRLHGRRYDTWFTDDKTIPAYERYNYLYSSAELFPWADRVKTLAETARDVYVITNNHYQGKGAVNALELISMLKESRIKVPEPLRKKYPELDAVALEPVGEPSLFDLDGVA